MEKDKGGLGVQPSFPPALHQNCKNPSPRSLMTTGPRPSVLANGRHAQRQRHWHVQLFIFGYLLLSPRYLWVDATPESPGRCVDLFWEAGYDSFFPGISGSHPESVSREAALTSVICVSLLSVHSCQRYGRPHMFFYEWTLEAPLGANVREERRAPGLQGLVKDNICLILWKQKTLVCRQWLQVLQVHKYIEVMNTGRRKKRRKDRSVSNATGQIYIRVGVAFYKI